MSDFQDDRQNLHESDGMSDSWDGWAAGKNQFYSLLSFSLCPQVSRVGNLHESTLQVLPNGKTRGGHTNHNQINNALICPTSKMTDKTCTNRTKRPIRGTDGQREKISFTAFYRSTAAPKFPMWETCMNQLYKFCRTAKLGTDIRTIIRLTMR